MMCKVPSAVKLGAAVAGPTMTSDLTPPPGTLNAEMTPSGDAGVVWAAVQPRVEGSGLPSSQPEARTTTTRVSERLVSFMCAISLPPT